MITPLLHALCEWFAGAWSAPQSFKNGSILTFLREGAHALENSDLWHSRWNWPSSDKPHQIAFLMYSWPLLLLYPPVNFPPFPSRSALHAVGQSNGTALQLLPARLPAYIPGSSASHRPHRAPITFLIRWWFPPSSWSSAGVRGARTCCQHKMVLNQVDGELRNTIKA